MTNQMPMGKLQTEPAYFQQLTQWGIFEKQLAVGEAMLKEETKSHVKGKPDSENTALTHILIGHAI